MSEPTNKFDPEQHANAMARTMGLDIHPNWMPSVQANLIMLEAAAQLVLQHDLPDESESALIFGAYGGNEQA